MHYLKIYGDKTNGKTYYNGKIAIGGTEYVKQMLDIGGESAYLDCIDNKEPQIIESKKRIFSHGYFTFL